MLPAPVRKGGARRRVYPATDTGLEGPIELPMSEEVRGLTENKRPKDDANVGEVGRPEPGLWGLLLPSSDAPPFLGWPAQDQYTPSLGYTQLTICKTHSI
jgi:hypothetical protein